MSFLKWHKIYMDICENNFFPKTHPPILWIKKYDY